jgi:hypothetical protein
MFTPSTGKRTNQKCARAAVVRDSLSRGPADPVDLDIGAFPSLSVTQAVVTGLALEATSFATDPYCLPGSSPSDGQSESNPLDEPRGNRSGVDS